MSIDSEPGKWFEAMGVPSEIEGPLKGPIQNLNTLFEENDRALESRSIEGRSFKIIPELETLYSRVVDGGPNKYMNASVFFMRPTKWEKKTGPFDSREEPFIYAYIKPDIRVDTRYALKLDVLRGTVSDMGDESIELEDPTFVKKLFTESISATSLHVKRLATNHDKKIKQRVRRGGLLAGALATVSLAAFGVVDYFDGKQEEREQAEIAKKAFDRSGYRLDSRTFNVNEATFAKLSEREFNRIPEYSEGDSLEGARRVEFDENDCKELETAIPVDSDVLLAVKSSDSHKDEPVGIIRGANNNINVCGLRHLDSNKPSDREIAIQLR